MIEKYALFDYEDESISQNIEGHPRYKVYLSNGGIIYQDDFRQYDFEDERKYSTWARIRRYCYDENLDIESIILQFRTNFISINEKANGYYFCKSILGGFGMEQSINYFVIGTVKDDLIHIKKYQVPELILSEESTRELDFDSPCLILNSEIRKNVTNKFSRKKETRT